MLALALLVCEWESGTSRNTWRHPTERDRRYLAALIQWGYQPSEVEQFILTAGTDHVPDIAAEQEHVDTEPSGSASEDDLEDAGSEHHGGLDDNSSRPEGTDDEGSQEGADHDV